MSKILLVDDDKDILSVYEEVLNDEGYEVISAVNGEEALNKINSTPFDIILLDIMLPKIDGMTLLELVKNSSTNPASPVIMLTNFGQDDLVKKALNMGATDYLLKYNMTPGEIVEKVKKILSPETVQM